MTKEESIKHAEKLREEIAGFNKAIPWKWRSSYDAFITAQEYLRVLKLAFNNLLLHDTDMSKKEVKKFKSLQKLTDKMRTLIDTNI